MIKLTDLALMRGVKVLFRGVTLAIPAGRRVGVIGANGTGKSSLFALLQGQLGAEEGSIDRPDDWRIAHVAQETPALSCSALDFALDGDSELRELESRMEHAEGHALAEIHDRYLAIDGYSAKARAGRLLSGLGFDTPDHANAVSGFSGGWRVRLNLARALMSPSDLLLLDEPTNHLDLDAVIWLENWLKSYSGTLLLISHDRDFLDSVVNSIAHLENGGITLYTGNYSEFEKQRAARLSQLAAAGEKQRRERAHLEKFITRFRAKATKAKQAQSRIKALARMPEIAAAHADSPFHFSFFEPDKLPNPLLRLDEARAGYGRNIVLDKVNLDLTPGSRLGLLGRNGAGKSTLIKMLAGELAPLGGSCNGAQGLDLGYFAQHQLEQLRDDWNPLKHLQMLSPTTGEQELRNFLGGFGFRGDAVTAKVEPFSGGEKARLVLALTVWKRPNLLLLDEPTNHLDLEMRHALTLALQEFGGAIVLVSHDRHLLRSCVDQFVLVGDGKVEEFTGDLDDYRDYLSGRNIESPVEETAETNRPKESRREQAEKRNRAYAKTKPLRQRIERIEKSLANLGEQKVGVESELADADIYLGENKARLKELLLTQSDVGRQIMQLEEEWLEVQDELETREAEMAES